MSTYFFVIFKVPYTIFRHNVCLEEYMDLSPRLFNTIEYRIGYNIDFFCISCKECKGTFELLFCIQIPHEFHNIVILLQNKTKYGLVGTKG